MPTLDTKRHASRRSGRRLALLLTATLSALALGLAAAPASAGESDRLIYLVNSARSRAGLPALGADAKLNSIAQSHAQKMATAGRIYHNSSYASQATPWTAWGENVGSGPDVDSVHKAFMASATHRGNVLSSKFDLVGVGIARWSGGIMVVEDFLRRQGGAGVPVATSARPRAHASPPPGPPPPPPPPGDPLEPMGCHWVGSQFETDPPAEPALSPERRF